MLKKFTENTAYFDDQIDLINQTLNDQIPYGSLERKIYSIAKPAAKVILYTKAIIQLFDFRD